MDLTTDYLGLKLAHPLVPGASPLVDNLDNVRRLEDAGAPAIVLHSLFEEQLRLDREAIEMHFEGRMDANAEATSFFPRAENYVLGPDTYLAQLWRIRKAVDVPVIASLNGTTVGGWTGFAAALETAGADALELNFYHVSTDPSQSAEAVEDTLVEVVRSVRSTVRIPVAVKLSPFYTALPHLAARLDKIGVEGLVLFNRFYQPDLDLENLDVLRTLSLSDSSELRLRLRWLAILRDRGTRYLASSGGVHEPIDALKAVAAGADSVQVVSALLRHGPERLKVIADGMRTWLEEHEYESIDQLRGSLSLARCPDPAAFERGNYLKILQSWRPPASAV